MIQETRARLQTKLEKFKKEHDLHVQLKQEQEKQQEEALMKARLAFQEEFDKTILAEVKGLVTELGPLFKEHNWALKYESHKDNEYFSLPTNSIEPYIVLAIDSRKKRLHERWQSCPLLVFESDIMDSTVKIYSYNETLNRFNNPEEWLQADRKLLYEAKLAQFRFDQIPGLFENLIDHALLNIEKLERLPRRKLKNTGSFGMRPTAEAKQWKDKY